MASLPHECAAEPASMRRKLIIDTDCGIDDAGAVLLALSDARVEVLAITAVHGNTSIDNVVTNILRVLSAAGRTQVPVFRGASTSLLNTSLRDASHYHGVDGLGDFKGHAPLCAGDFCLGSEHAVTAIIRLLQQHEGVEVACLGPLTNLALAMRMEPSIGKRIAHLAIMGGNYKGKGNVTSASEFNFYRDPEAAHIVLQDMAHTSITMLPWETSLENVIPVEALKKLLAMETGRGQFLRNVYSQLLLSDKLKHGFVACDDLLMACLLQPDIVTDKFAARFRVQLACSWAKGLAIVDCLDEEAHAQDCRPFVTVITNCDKHKFMSMLHDALKG